MLKKIKDLTKGGMIIEKPQELYNKIKEKRDNAQKCLHSVIASKIEDVRVELIGQINAYNDVLSLMESMFEVEREVRPV